MIEELSSMANRFESLDRKLGELVREIMLERGLTKQTLDAITETEIRQLRSGAAEPYWPDRVPKTIEIVSAYEWRAGTTTHCALVFASKEGKYLILGNTVCALGLKISSRKSWWPKRTLAKHCLLLVDPRPKTSVPWNYGITLANGYILRARPGKVNGRAVCHFGLRRVARTK